MDKSVVSEYDNIPVVKDYSESVLYEAVNNVLSGTTTNGNKIFCPLCVRTFELKFSLQDHLKSKHFAFLCIASGKNILFQQCPFCYANFVERQTVVKHALQTHSNVIARLYLHDDGNGDSFSQCFFCTDLFCNKFIFGFIYHIEHKHFLEFSELFVKQFMEGGSSFQSPKEDQCNKNCFDFSSLNKQLCNFENSQMGLKSILKSKTPKLSIYSPSMKKKSKVCRVLQFDLPDNNKENLVLSCNINSSKEITFAEHGLLCNPNTKEMFNNAFDVTVNAKPLHCSTPKERANCKKKADKLSDLKKKLKVKKKPTFKSYCFEKDFNFQCGKCNKIFQENTELNCHVKKNHKLFILNLLHPCYQCAICKAKFFKNYYLKKHIHLHSNCRRLHNCH